MGICSQEAKKELVEEIHQEESSGVVGFWLDQSNRILVEDRLDMGEVGG